MKRKSHSPKRATSAPSPAYAGFYPVIAPLVMGNGVGDGKTTACVVAQSATIDALRKGNTLDAPTDRMECACPILRALAIRLNDGNWWKDDAERTKVLRPLIPLLLDSVGDEAVTLKRRFLCADRIIRDLTPLRLGLIGARDGRKNAKFLRAMKPIENRDDCDAARVVLRELECSARLDASVALYYYSAAAVSADVSSSTSVFTAPFACDPDANRACKLALRTSLLQLFNDVAAIK